MSKIKANKTVFNKEQYGKVVDREFTTFVPAVKEDTSVSVADFFTAYDELFYAIPATGSSNSHEYLIKRSSELVTFDQSTEDIEPLLNEITQLRTQLLEANKTIIELQSGIDING